MADEKYMKRAIFLARKGMGKTSPNPSVGAVLVKDGKVLSSAYHKKAGLMHAEATVIKMAGKKARGATLYSTLEACTHYGKTPPCSDAIIKSGIGRAVFAMRDPNPVNYGRGIAKLRSAGIKTKCGIMRKEAYELNKPFIKAMTRRLPYVTLKMAQSLDGKIADTKGSSRWISSEASRRLVHKMRGQSDAVMIGVNTLLKDNPRLTGRIRGTKKQPLRIIVDTELDTSLQARIFKNGMDKGGDILIAAGKGASPKKKALLEKKGANVVLLPRSGNRVNLTRLMRFLKDLNIMSVLCEGGGELTASLLKNKLADEVLFFISPRIIGGRAAPTSCGGGESDIRKSIGLKDMKTVRVGNDILVRGNL
ncbi:MAG: bifunctional diaminohydroxyphosphoribosylaminopyrimidine deaminase/5-amino-6-(5-phosphoribosylamino)uracil reductase RibD [Candidatus Omnitrophota bacterium]